MPTKDNPTSKGTIELELWLQWTRGYDPVSAKGHYVETVDFFNKHWKLYEGTVGEGADRNMSHQWHVHFANSSRRKKRLYVDACD